jgi:hypothetical protein
MSHPEKGQCYYLDNKILYVYVMFIRSIFYCKKIKDLTNEENVGFHYQPLSFALLIEY